MSSIATLRGVALRPGVSANRRLYTPELIRGAHEALRADLASGKSVPVMFTSHAKAGEDDVLSVVASLRGVGLTADHQLTYEAEVADTTAGRDLLTLVRDGHVPGVSIRGEWVGEMREVPDESGALAITADGLRISGIDFTTRPGVSGAHAMVADSSSRESASRSPRAITESAEPALVEEANKTPYGDVQYADPGYQADKVKRYPLDTEKHVRAAWSYINQADNAAKYTAAQARRIRARIKAAMKRFGIKASESAPGQWVYEDVAITVSADRPALIPVDPDGDGDVDALVCPTCGSVRQVTDPAMNPDAAQDGDVSAEAEDDDDMGPHQENAVSDAAPITESQPEAKPAELSESTIAAIGAAVAAALKESQTPAAPVATPAQEQAPALTEATVKEIAEKAASDAREQMKGELMDLIRRGVIAVKRQGLVAQESAPAAAPAEEAKPLHKASTNELREHASSVFGEWAAQSFPQVKAG